MCGRARYGEVEGLVSVERGSCSRGGRVWWREGRRECKKGEREDEGGGNVGSAMFMLRTGKRIS